MVPELREKFNKEFTEEKYQNVISDLWGFTGGKPDFRVSETPLFIDKTLTQRLIDASNTILELLKNVDLIYKCNDAIPQKYFVGGEEKHPIFLQLDFGITKDESENFIPQLIELQGFPSL